MHVRTFSLSQIISSILSTSTTAKQDAALKLLIAQAFTVSCLGDLRFTRGQGIVVESCGSEENSHAR